LALIDAYLALDCLLHPQRGSAHIPAIVEIAKKLPIQNILLETDKPRRLRMAHRQGRHAVYFAECA